MIIVKAQNIADLKAQLWQLLRHTETSSGDPTIRSSIIPHGVSVNVVSNGIHIKIPHQHTEKKILISFED